MGWGEYPPELAWWTGGRPRALVAGEGWGGVGAGSKKWQGVGSSRPLGPRLGLGGGSKSFGAGGLQGLSKFRNLRRIFDVSNAYKKKEMTFFEGCPVGWGGTPCVVFLTFSNAYKKKNDFF